VHRDLKPGNFMLTSASSADGVASHARFAEVVGVVW
jgi:serine/threonine protein kinase